MLNKEILKEIIHKDCFILNVLILMAGQGTRFKDFSADIPKPLVPLHGQPLVRWVVENLNLSPHQKFIFLCLKEHVEKFHLKELFQSWGINFEIVIAQGVTEGAACSALLAEKLIDTSTPLIIANSDQFVLYDNEKFTQALQSHDGLIMTMAASGSKWSYVALSPEGLVQEVKEKVQISNTGTVGIYFFKEGHHFVSAAKEMINANDRHNNEFYLAPCYNYMIRAGKNVSHFDIGTIGNEMFGLGTSEDFMRFQNNPLSQRLAKELFS